MSQPRRPDGATCWCGHGEADHEDGVCRRCYWLAYGLLNPTHRFMPLVRLRRLP